MKMNLSKATLDLDRLQIVRLRGAKGVRLTCRKGMLWVTQEGIRRDDFLAPGCGVTVETGGTVLVEALSASSATVEHGEEAVEVSTAVDLAPG
jgi:hypothetical protein